MRTGAWRPHCAVAHRRARDGPRAAGRDGLHRRGLGRMESGAQGIPRRSRCAVGLGVRAGGVDRARATGRERAGEVTCLEGGPDTGAHHAAGRARQAPDRGGQPASRRVRLRRSAGAGRSRVGTGDCGTIHGGADRGIARRAGARGPGSSATRGGWQACCCRPACRSSPATSRRVSEAASILSPVRRSRTRASTSRRRRARRSSRPRRGS